MPTSKNPYSGEILKNYTELDRPKILQKLERAETEFQDWKLVPVAERAELMKKVSKLLLKHKEKYADMITEEMGKPISQSFSEIEKCAWVCDYYAANSEDFLKEEVIETDAHKTYVRFDPIGVVFGVMPWNFPF